MKITKSSINIYSAPKRAAASPSVPQPQPKSATTLSLKSPNEFSAWIMLKKESSVTIQNIQRKGALL